MTLIVKQPIVRTKLKQLEQLYKAKQQELEKLTAVTDNLYMDWKTGDITKADYLRMKAKFEQKVNEVTQIISNLETEMATVQKGIGVNHPYLQTFLKHKNIQALDRGLLVELIDTIYIHENKEITIQFNFADQHRHMLEFIQQNKKQFMAMKNQVM